MTADDARNAARVRQQEKVAWMKAVGADPNLSSAAARLGVMAALHLAYAKGYIYANRDELGQLSGLSVRSVTRAAAELAQQHYWRIDSKPGANKYTLVLPNDRLELWLEAERKWGSLARQWDAAKHDWEWRVTRWLETEAQHQWLEAEFWAKYEFTRDIAAAIRARGGDNGRARRAADNLWAGHQAGAVALEAAIQHIAAMPQGQFDERFREPEPTTFVPPMTPDGPPPGQIWYPAKLLPALTLRAFVLQGLTRPYKNITPGRLWRRPAHMKPVRAVLRGVPIPPRKGATCAMPMAWSALAAAPTSLCCRGGSISGARTLRKSSSIAAMTSVPTLTPFAANWRPDGTRLGPGIRKLTDRRMPIVKLATLIPGTA